MSNLKFKKYDFMIGYKSVMFSFKGEIIVTVYVPK